MLLPYTSSVVYPLDVVCLSVSLSSFDVFCDLLLGSNVVACIRVGYDYLCRKKKKKTIYALLSRFFLFGFSLFRCVWKLAFQCNHLPKCLFKDFDINIFNFLKRFSSGDILIITKDNFWQFNSKE